ncbi:hypothetical protein Trydic_g20671 [Trypoxylus dichotomus]
MIETKEARYKPKSGPSRKITIADKRLLKTTVLHYRQKDSRELDQESQQITGTLADVSNIKRLSFSCVTMRKTFLRRGKNAKSLKYAIDRLIWTNNHWK